MVARTHLTLRYAHIVVFASAFRLPISPTLCVQEVLVTSTTQKVDPHHFRLMQRS